MRISEFAKELGKSNKEIIDILAGQGVTGRTHSSNISDAEADSVRKVLSSAKTMKPAGGPAAEGRSDGAPAAVKQGNAGAASAPAAGKAGAGTAAGQGTARPQAAGGAAGQQMTGTADRMAKAAGSAGAGAAAVQKSAGPAAQAGAGTSAEQGAALGQRAEEAGASAGRKAAGAGATPGQRAAGSGVPAGAGAAPGQRAAGSGVSAGAGVTPGQRTAGSGVSAGAGVTPGQRTAGTGVSAGAGAAPGQRTAGTGVSAGAGAAPGQRAAGKAGPTGAGSSVDAAAPGQRPTAGANGAPAPKKKLIAVYRPQNAETMKGARTGQNQGRRDGARPQGPAGMRPQGTAPNGMRPQGAAPNGMRPQGAAPNGMRPQGAAPNGMRPQGQNGMPAGMRQQGAAGVRPHGSTGTGLSGAGSQSQGAAGVRPQNPAGASLPGVGSQGQGAAGVRPQNPAGASSSGVRSQGQSEAGVRPQNPVGASSFGVRPQGQGAAGIPAQNPAGEYPSGMQPQGQPAAGARPQGAAGQPTAASSLNAAGQSPTGASTAGTAAAPAMQRADAVPAPEINSSEKTVSGTRESTRSQNGMEGRTEGIRVQGQNGSLSGQQGTAGQSVSAGDGIRLQGQVSRDGDRGGRSQAGYADGRDDGSQGSSGAERDRRSQSGFGSRDSRSQGVYGSRDGRSQDSYGNRDGRVQGGFAGSYADRDGSRDSRTQGGYGSRDGRTQGGYAGGYGDRDGSRPQGGYGSRDGRTQGGYAGGYRDRDGRGQGSFAGRDGRPQGGYAGSYGGRDGSRTQGGFAGGYGSRDGRTQGGNAGGRDGSRDGRVQGSYAGNYGNRDSRVQGGNAGGYGGRDGSRDSRAQGGYAGGYGSRDGRTQGGYAGSYGSRDGSRAQGGYGSRDGSRPQGGYGSRDGVGRTPGGRPGGRDGGKAFDTSIASKPQSGRAQKNAHKNDRYDNKRSMNEDGPKTKGKSATNKHPFIMPQKTEEAKVEDSIKIITLPETLTIKELADKMKLQPSAIVKKLFLKGTIVTLNQEIDYDQAEEIAMEYDVLCEKEEKEDVIADLLREDEENEDEMVPRPPVVCVMGHVDHGKTSLLDAIRQTNVTSHEAGGITQHIGAYMAEIRGQKITFLDTPGHEAFTAMRMRGAQATDIAVLVVAADDGVMPQTVEAINHAKAAGVEIIVAVNKIDKPGANVERVKQEMTEYDLVPEDWGGSTIFVPVSAHTKEGIPELLEMILLTAEVKELKANPNRNARGLVIEAQLDKGKGPVATMLVQKGTLRVGDNVAVGACYGKVRAMMDDKGRRVKEALPSTPVEILGLNGVPGAGEIFVSCDSEREARSFAETFISEGKSRLIEDTKAKLSLDDLFSQIQAGNVKELPIIVKADVQGSVEAVTQSLTKLSNEEVVVKVIHGGVGAINESDVTLASASNAIIIGFNVRPDATAKSIAEQEMVDIRLYRVIYQAIEDVEAAMKGMLDPIFEEQVIGHAVVRQTFRASGVGTIAGSYVLDGKLQRGCSVRVTRDGEKLYDGPLASLKRFKDDVKEVAAGYECGLSLEKFNDIQEDDQIEAYAMVEVPR